MGSGLEFRVEGLGFRVVRFRVEPLSGIRCKLGICKTVEARFWPCLKAKVVKTF